MYQEVKRFQDYVRDDGRLFAGQDLPISHGGVEVGGNQIGVVLRDGDQRIAALLRLERGKEHQICDEVDLFQRVFGAGQPLEIDAHVYPIVNGPFQDATRRGVEVVQMLQSAIHNGSVKSVTPLWVPNDMVMLYNADSNGLDLIVR